MYKVQATLLMLGRVQLFASPWTVAHQAPLSMEFSRPRILEWVVISFSLKSEVLVTQCVRLFAIPWTVTHQAPLSMEFSRPRILEWVAIAFSAGSSRPRD